MSSRKSPEWGWSVETESRKVGGELVETKCERPAWWGPERCEAAALPVFAFVTLPEVVLGLAVGKGGYGCLMA